GQVARGDALTITADDQAGHTGAGRLQHRPEICVSALKVRRTGPLMLSAGQTAARPRALCKSCGQRTTAIPTGCDCDPGQAQCGAAARRPAAILPVPTDRQAEWQLAVG